MQSLVLDPSVHIVRDTPFAGYLRRHFNEPDCLTYWHAKRNVWVAGVWLNKMRGEIKEFVVIGPNLGGASSYHVGVMEGRMKRGSSPDEIRRAVAADRRAAIRDQEETQEAWESEKAAIRSTLQSKMRRDDPRFRREKKRCKQF